MNAGIYIITNPYGFIYIGQSIDVNKRISGYKNFCSNKQVRLSRSLKKYGSELHTFEIITKCEISQLDLWEKFYIKLFDTFGTKHGLNLRGGGANGKASLETKERMSAAQKGKVVNESTRQKLRLANLGKLRPVSEKLKISNSMKGLVKSKQHLNNLKISMRKSSKVKSSLLTLQDNNKKPVINLSTGEIFISAKAAALHYNIRYESLTQSIRRGSKNNIFNYV